MQLCRPSYRIGYRLALRAHFFSEVPWLDLAFPTSSQVAGRGGQRHAACVAVFSLVVCAGGTCCHAACIQTCTCTLRLRRCLSVCVCVCIIYIYIYIDLT